MAKTTITQFPTGQSQYRIEFDYLARPFVVVTLVNSADQTQNKVLRAGDDYRFLTPTLIEVRIPHTGFDTLQIHRQTDTELIVGFRDGSVLTAKDLTNAELQAIHISEEGRDQTVDLAKEYADAAAKARNDAEDARDSIEQVMKSGLYGYTLVEDFQKGATLSHPAEALRWTLPDGTGEYYRWDGVFPKLVPAGSTPASSGGVGVGAWVSIGDASLRGNLANPAYGDGLVASQLPNSPVARTVHDKMLEAVSIADYMVGGDVAGSIVKAVAETSGTIIVPPGDYVASPTLAEVPAVLKLLSRADFRGRLTINLPDGTVNLNEQTVINSNRSDLCKVIGVALNTRVTGLVSVAGSSKQYSITLSLADASQVSVGDYAIFRHDLTGTGFFHIHCGGWRVTAVSGNNVTVLNTCVLASFPASTVTGGSVSIIKSVLKYTGCDGIRPEGGDCIGIIDNVAIVGDYNLATGAGTIGAHGVISTTPVVVADAANASNNVANMAAALALGRNIAISAWGEQGLAVSGRSALVCNFISSCANRKRGIYAEGAHIRGKFMVASGNGEDGIISDTTGFVQAAYAVCSGNGLNGFWSTNLSLIAAARGVACCNKTNGVEARGQTRLAFDLGLSYGNVLSGVSASEGAMIDFDGGMSRDNLVDGVVATYNAVVDANNASSTSNGRYGTNVTSACIIISGTGTISGNTGADVRDNGNGMVVRPDGTLYPFTGVAQGNLSLRNTVSGAGVDMVPTSVGDLILSLKNSAGGTLNPLYIFKADGTQHPQNDATQSLGRPANRYNVGYFAGGTQSTSDARLKDPIRDFSEAELKAAVACSKSLGFWTWLDDDSKRLHAGTTVQRVLEILEDNGLDWREYGFIGFDSWEDEYKPVVAEIDGLEYETGEVVKVVEAGTLWQLRDQEFDRFLIRGLSARLSAIEED